MGLLDGMEPILLLRPCKVRRILESLDKDDRKLLEAAIADRTKWTSYALSRALAERGIDIKADTLSVHRRGECSCSKT
jgi:L-ribulose-5-phosphate 3-epimerase UlaE